MPQNLIPFNQLPTLSTNNELRLPPIQTLTQYCCTPKPVPFVPLFPPSNNSQAITHVSRNISPPIKTSFVFHQVNPNNSFPSSTTSFQPSKYNQLYENPPIQKKTSQSCMPNNLTFVNMDLSTNKKLKPTSNNIENTFQVSNVGSSSCNFRTPLIVDNSRVQNNSLSNTVQPMHQPQVDSSVRRKNKKQAQESSSMTMENPQEETNSFRTTSNRNLPKQAVSIMKDWIFKHSENPYPSEEEKAQIQNQTGLSLKRINYWFINARRRLLPSNENKKRPTSNNFQSADPKRLRKNSIVSSSSNLSNCTVLSSYTTASSSASSIVSSSENEEECLSQSSDERAEVKVVDSWVVDCLLTLREENKH